MENIIPPIPALPQEVIDAINSESLAIFVGAGVSRLIGCEGWNGLARNLIDKCFNTTNGTERCINEEQKEILSNSKDCKKVISICYEILKNNHEDLFFEELERSLKKDEEIDLPIYTEVYNLLQGTVEGIEDISGIYLTTNADEHFDEYFNDKTKIISNPDEFRSEDIGEIKLYHVHGTISQKDTLVFTVSQYFKRYNDKKFLDVLREIFDTYVILFIGYGLDEFEVIDFLFTKLGLEDKEYDKIELKDFLLKGYTTDGSHELDFDNLYYNKLGITVLGYDLGDDSDDKNYAQLYDVLINWNEEISDRETRIYEATEEMMGIIHEHERPKE